LETVWRLTHKPALDQRWDLRFTEIEYLPRPDKTEPQRFLYTTRIGFGLAIRGTGESVGTRSATDGDTSSALKFGMTNNGFVCRPVWDLLSAPVYRPEIRATSIALR
jgi:hypothetical protein